MLKSKYSKIFKVEAICFKEGNMVYDATGHKSQVNLLAPELFFKF